MYKIIIIFSILLVIIFSIGVSAQQEAAPSQPKEKPTIAITTFENLSAYPENAWVAMSFSESLTGKFKNLYERFRLVERIRIYEVIKENGLDPEKADSLNIDKQKEIGKYIGATYLIIGSVSLQGSGDDLKTSIMANARMVDVGTGEIKQAESIKGQMEQLFELETRLAFDLLKQMGIEPTPEEAEKINLKETISIIANKYYSLGQKTFYAGDYETAKTLYNKAMETVSGIYYQAAELGLIRSLEQQKEAGDETQKAQIIIEAQRHREDSKRKRAEANERLYAEAQYSMIAEEYEAAIEGFQQYLDLAKPYRSIKWKYDLSKYGLGMSRTIYSPLLHEGMIYIPLICRKANLQTGELLGNYFSMVVVDSKSENILWSFEDQDYNNVKQYLFGMMLEELVCSPIVIMDETIYLPISETHILALDKKTHKLLWRFKLKEGGNTLSNLKDLPSLQVSNGMVCIKFQNGMLVALSAETGEPKWQFYTGIRGIRDVESFTVSNDRVYAGFEDGIIAFSVQTGKELWRVKLEGSFTLHIDNGILYVSVNGMYGNISALDLTTGKQLWEYHAFLTDIDKLSVIGKCLYAYGNNEIHVLSIENGELLWKKDMTGRIILSNERLFTIDLQELNRYSPETGKILWSVKSPKGSRSIKAITNTDIYLIGDQMLYVLDVITGEQLWKSPITDFTSALISNDNNIYFVGWEMIYAVNPKPKGLLPEQEESESLLGIGTALVALGRYEEAIPKLSSTLELRSDLKEAHWQLTLAYSGLHRWRESAWEMNKYLSNVSYTSVSAQVKKYLYENFGIQKWFLEKESGFDIRQYITKDEQYKISEMEPGLKWGGIPAPTLMKGTLNLFDLGNLYISNNYEEWTKPELLGQYAIEKLKASSRWDMKKPWLYGARYINYLSDNNRIYISFILTDELEKQKAFPKFILGAFSIEEEKLLWKFEIDKGKFLAKQFLFPVLLESDLIYLGIEGRLYALDKETGILQWEFHDENAPRLLMRGVPVGFSHHEQPFNELQQEQTSLVVYEGKIYITDGEEIFALSAQTGKQQWKRSISILGPVKVQSESVFAITEHEFYCLRTDTGDTKWQINIDRKNSIPQYTIDEDHVYLTTEYMIYVFSSRTGEMQWKFENRMILSDQPCVILGKDTVYLFAGMLIAFDKNTGEVKWWLDGVSGSSSIPGIEKQEILYLYATPLLYMLDLTQINKMRVEGKQWWAL